MRRAFTLIEILIAASVLGLGVLGIATLFAGAARQQQIAAEQTSSARAGSNIDSLLADRFERFAGVAFDDDATIGGPFFALGQWHPVASIPFGGTQNRPAGALSIDQSDNDQRDQTSFALSELADVTLYSLSGSLLIEEWAPTTNPPSIIWGQGASPSLNAPGGSFDPNVLGQIINPGWGFFPNRIPGGRVHPSVVIEVDIHREIVNALNTTEGISAFPIDTWSFEFLNWDDMDNVRARYDLWPNDQNPPGDFDRVSSDTFLELVTNENTTTTGSPPRRVAPQPGDNDPDAAWMRFEVRKPETSDPPFAFIRPVASGMEIIMPPNDGPAGNARHTIGEIRATNVELREDLMLSLSERLAYTPDDAVPGGQRPTGGVAMLFRRTESGNELMTISYAIEPLGRLDFNPQGNELPFVPPDTFERLYDTSNDPDQHGLLSQVELDLEYDETTQRYVLLADADEEWAIQRGQLLIISSTQGRVDPRNADRAADDDPGAGAVVEVVSTRRPDSRLEAVLDDSPRRRAASFLSDFAGTQRVYAWALRDIVRSDDGGAQGVDWRVRPTGAKVITFGGN